MTPDLSDLVSFILGAACMAGVFLTWKAEVGAKAWGEDIAALRRLPTSDPVEIEDVRLIHRGVPTDDGGDDLL